MSEEQKVEKNIADELGKLGKQAADTIKAAWESDDRKRIQSELTEGLQKFGNDISQAVQKVSEGEQAKDLKVKAEKVAVDLKESDVVEDVRKGILSGLDVLNKELGRLLEKLESKQAPEAPAEPESPAEPPASEG